MAHCISATAGRDDVDEVGIDQQRRKFEHRKRDRRLVQRQRLHDGGGRLGAARKHLGHRWRTSGDASSSCIKSAPSAAARSSADKSEINQARAKARVASARSPAGAVRIQLMNCRTIIVPASLRNL